MAEEKNSCGFRTSIGGQALIEGILMRGPEKQAIVVRDQDGNLVEKVEALKMILSLIHICGRIQAFCRAKLRRPGSKSQFLPHSYGDTGIHGELKRRGRPR